MVRQKKSKIDFSYINVTYVYPSWNTKWHIFIKTSRISYLIYLKCIFKFTFHLSWWHHKEKFSPYYIYMASWAFGSELIDKIQKCTLVGTFSIIFPKINNSKIQAWQILGYPKTNIYTKTQLIWTILRKDISIFVKLWI